MLFVMRVFASSPQRIRNKQHALGVCVCFVFSACLAELAQKTETLSNNVNLNLFFTIEC